MFKVTVQGVFSAAHHVRGYQGDCAGDHGHSYKIEVGIKVEKLDRLGMAIDFRRVKNELKKVLGRLDHQNLNKLPFFRRNNATAEWVAVYIFREMKKKIKQVHLVKVWEGYDNSVTYREDK
jgi:6-pyruvoyltetrahydropterin/6-carboxytetrahydropterin synthase